MAMSGSLAKSASPLARSVSMASGSSSSGAATCASAGSAVGGVIVANSVSMP